MLTEIYLQGKIPSLKNKRINTRSGRSFPSKEYSDWLAYAQMKYRAAWGNKEPVGFPLMVRVDAFGYRNDADNLAGSLLDSMQSIIYKNDSQVEDLRIRVRRKPLTRNCYIGIYRLEDEKENRELPA